MYLIVNPAAGGGKVGRRWPRLAERLAAVGFAPALSMTKAPGHASDLAAEAAAAGHEVVVAAGGDGTICEVLQGLHAAGRGALGILPLGTGNDAARTLGLPLRLEEAARAVLGGARRRVDLMCAGERVALNAIGFGLLGAINVNASSIKFVRGPSAYFAAATTTLFRYRCPEVEVSDGAFAYRGAMTFLAVQNGPTTGGGFRLCPAARPDDGHLDATLVVGTGLATRLGAITDALRGTLGSRWFAREVRFRRLDLACDEALPFHWDGNPGRLPHGGTRFEVLEGAIEVLVPERRDAGC